MYCAFRRQNTSPWLHAYVRCMVLITSEEDLIVFRVSCFRPQRLISYDREGASNTHRRWSPVIMLSNVTIVYSRLSATFEYVETGIPFNARTTTSRKYSPVIRIGVMRARMCFVRLNKDDS